MKPQIKHGEAHMIKNLAIKTALFRIQGTFDHLLKKGVIPLSFMKQFLPENPTIVEAGAHKGKDTLKLSKTWPKGFIHAFEPVPELYKKLLTTTQKRQNITCYPMALSDTSGTSKIYISGGISDGSSSLLKPLEHIKIFPDVTFDKSIEVDAITLDAWAQKYSIQHVDFLWLDLQGMELNVLKSGASLLKNVRALYTEVSLVETYKNAPLYPDLKDWLMNRGFEVRREEITGLMGNVLFVRQDSNEK
jgi:FkbM family methyltransferase